MAFEWYEADDLTLAGTDLDLSTAAGTASAAVELHGWLNKGSSVGSPETRFLRVEVEDPDSPGTWRSSGLDTLDRREFEYRVVGSQNPDLVPGFSVSTTAWRALGTRRTSDPFTWYPNCAIEFEFRVNPTIEGGSSSPATYRVRAVQGTTGDVPISIPTDVTVDGTLDMGGQRITDLPLVTVTTDATDAATVGALRSSNSKPSVRVIVTDSDSWTDIVTNGTFTTDLTGWTGTNWAQSAGTALHTVGSTAALTQSLTIVDGLTYRVRFTVSGRTAGDVTPGIGSVTVSAVSADGVSEQFVVPGAGGTLDLKFIPSSDFDGALDSITVEPLLYGLITADGQTLVADDRVLVYLVGAPPLSGKWIVKNAAPWERHPDSLDHYYLNAGAEVFVREGTTNAKSVWIQTLALTDITTSPQEWILEWQAP